MNFVCFLLGWQLTSIGMRQVSVSQCGHWYNNNTKENTLFNDSSLVTSVTVTGCPLPTIRSGGEYWNRLASSTGHTSIYVAPTVNGAGCHRWRVLLNQTPPTRPTSRFWLAVLRSSLANAQISLVNQMSIPNWILFRVGWLADQLEDSSRLTLHLQRRI